MTGESLCGNDALNRNPASEKDVLDWDSRLIQTLWSCSTRVEVGHCTASARVTPEQNLIVYTSSAGVTPE